MLSFIVGLRVSIGLKGIELGFRINEEIKFKLDGTEKLILENCNRDKRIDRKKIDSQLAS